MKFECSTDQFLSGISIAVRFIARGANLPILNSVLIAAESGALVLRATNLECGVEVTVPAKVQEGGVLAVPAATLAGFLANARGKTVSAQLSGEVLTVKTERSTATLKTVPHDDFPTLPKVSAEKTFSVRSTDLARAIRSVAYCASVSAIKPELQSISLAGEAGKLTLVATDSFRLAEKQIPLRSQGGLPPLLIPVRNAAELMKLLEAVSEDVDFYYNENQLSIHVDRVYYTSRLIDGSFPNYKQIVPASFSTEAVVLREDFAASLKSLSVFADKFSQVSFSVSPAKKQVVLTSRNADVGEEVCTLSSTASGDEAVMTFNGRYLADCLQSIAGESIRLLCNGPGKPMLIKDAADESFLYIAMPMNR